MVYDAREDTFLMNSALSKETLFDKKIMEMGCGNSYNAIFCAIADAKVSAVDIDPLALKFGREQANKKEVSIQFIESNMFEKIKEDNFDIIFFNPPYLVSEEIKYIDLDGLEKGRYWIDKFIDKFDKHLKDNGFALLLHTDYNDLEETKTKLTKKGYKYTIICREKLFFEELYVLKIQKK